jgi:hypothetical protein
MLKVQKNLKISVDVPSIATTADGKLGHLFRILCHSGIDGQVTKEANKL